MPQTTYHFTTDDPQVESALRDTLHAADIDDINDDDELTERDMRRLQRHADRVYYKTTARRLAAAS